MKLERSAKVASERPIKFAFVIVYLVSIVDLI